LFTDRDENYIREITSKKELERESFVINILNPMQSNEYHELKE